MSIAKPALAESALAAQADSGSNSEPPRKRTITAKTDAVEAPEPR